MNWYDEWLRERQEKDNIVFKNAFSDLAGAVLDKKIVDALDNRAVAQSAIEEILSFFHLKPKVQKIPENLSSVDEQLEFMLRPFGIMRRTVTLDKGFFKNSVGIMLATLKEDGSAVALIPGKFSGYYFMNLKTGEKERITRKNESLFDSEAICFYKPFKNEKITFSDVLKFLLEQISLSDIFLYLGIMLALTLVGLLSPLFTKWLFGTVILSKSLTVLFALATFMFAYHIGRQLFTIFSELLHAKITTKLDIALQSATMARLLALSPTFFKKYSAGELNQIVTYFQNISIILMDGIVKVGLTTLLSAIYLFQIFSFAPSLIWPSVIVILATAVIIVISTILDVRNTREKMQLASKTSGITYSMITGIQKIKLAGAEKRTFSRWAKAYSAEAAVEYNSPLFLKISKTLVLSTTLLGTTVLYLIASKNNISVDDFFAFLTSFGLITVTFPTLEILTKGIANLKSISEIIKPILDEKPEISDGKAVISKLQGAIELQNVSFRYTDDMPMIIDNLSLKIKPGEYVAIVGSTGCGKSTLMRLLLGFERPLKGSIFYDKKDMKSIDLKSLRKKIGTVMQDGKLFLSDIYSNIVISAPELTIDDAWKAAELASIADDIRAMPMGMHTLISEGSGGISGGQRQRLMIARALAPSPKILMFDEATSALDNVTQKNISDAIDKLKCTRIVIAHRLSTIRHCDRIIVLDKGKIVESGTYEELIENNGFFAELVARQRLDTND